MGHIYWVEPDVDGYFVATSETSQGMTRRGVEAARIRVTGIPVDPAIAEPKDPAQMRQIHKLDPPPVVTFLGGGLAAGRAEQIIQGLISRGVTGTLLVLAGRNTRLQAGLPQVKSGLALHVRGLGVVECLDDLIAASDLVITKAGGLVVSEVMARRTPMILVDCIPGQEEWNADYAVSVGAAVQLRLVEMIPFAVENLLGCPFAPGRAARVGGQGRPARCRPQGGRGGAS